MLVFIVDKVIFDLINNRKIKPEDFTQWTYSSAINMLKQVGMVFKEKRVWRLNSLWLVELMKEWNEWLGVDYIKVNSSNSEESLKSEILHSLCQP